MRVIHVITGLGQGGAEAMLEKLIMTARRVSPEVEQRVINLGNGGAVGERLAAAGVAVESLDLRLHPGALSRLLTLPRKLAPGARVTVVQTWLWHADLIGGLSARVAGNPRVVWNLRNSMPRHAATKPTSRAVARLCAWLSRSVPARIICNSRAALEAHIAAGYEGAKCVCVPNGFDLQRFHPSDEARARVRREWGVADGEPLVGMVARVDPLKDHACFIGAAAEVARLRPQARFVLVGTGVSSDAAIRRLIAEAGLNSRVILEQRREDVPDVMSALDILCLASRSEGFPNVLGEAMACATPAISSDVGDAREIIGDGALIAPVGDARAMAGCIIRVIDMREEDRRALGQRQRDSIGVRYDLPRIWQQYLAVYRSL
jgi:glycosyltransferase involved in cell wall biosynthesis